jgi:hypothetical protein
VRLCLSRLAQSDTQGNDDPVIRDASKTPKRPLLIYLGIVSSGTTSHVTGYFYTSYPRAQPPSSSRPSLLATHRSIQAVRAVHLVPRYCGHMIFRKNLLSVLDPLQLDLSLLVIQIVRQCAKRTIAEKQINLFQGQFLGFL